MGAKVSQPSQLQPPSHKTFSQKRPKPITTNPKSFLPSLSTTPNHLTTQSHLPTCYSLTPQAGSLSSLSSSQGLNKESSFEIFLVGSSSVGKTSLVNQYCNGTFDECSSPTIGFDFKVQKVQTEKKSVRVKIWDTPRQGDLAKVMKNSQGKKGFLMVYDVTDRESFKDVQKLMNEIKKYGTLKAENFLVGNKVDDKEKREVKYCEGKKFAEQEGFKFFEVSATNEDDVQEMFQEMIIGLVCGYEEEESLLLDQSKGTRIEDIELC